MKVQDYTGREFSATMDAFSVKLYDFESGALVSHMLLTVFERDLRRGEYKLS